MPEPATFRVMLRMQIKPGMEQQFEEAWLRVGEVITGHPANRGQCLARSLDEHGVYYITSDWADEPQFREFERSEEHVRHRERLHPFRSGGSMFTMQIRHALTRTRAIAGTARTAGDAGAAG
jgi:heme oxygenase (mycobilin-producing)